MPPNSQIGKLRQGQFRGRGTGLDSRDLGLVKLGLFSFLRGGGKRWPRLRSPSGMVLLHTQSPRTCSGCSFLGRLETMLCPWET